ncbi:MBL fold metallo-hydrolase [Mucilaginibacter sp. X4EP1]|uniref:MBL fold metallo-hydrolase n=1 Tax=Mucilaginibacter sp. X4EP1 TaxID=2723092 RepID=UPI00216816E7|nr:MBL fold metallo-hydrolase [Mucilaginibacter sp. X4EP1]MCS3815450.1 glyoxylase-like metal-dependent hydrolase (beta-lactamase superfamily II) [Mucilaginibacter sp. X4EP1]
MKNQATLFLKTLALSILISTVVPRLANAQESTTVKILPQPGYYNMQIGDLPVTVLSDGTNPLDMAQLLLNAKPGELKSGFAESFLSTTVESSDNEFLIRTDGKLILVDAGSGDLLGASFGQLTKSLQNAGVQPEQIDAVLLTHLHPDHVGGLMRNGKMVFPNATIYIAKAESDFWLIPEALKNAPAAYKPFFEYAQNAALPYAKAGKLKAFKSGDVLFPGITALGSAGHTAGHTSYVIESNGDKLLILGDLIHAQAVQFADPGIAIGYDSDPKEAVSTRRRVFDDAVKGKYLVAGSHLSFPGVGHIKANGNGYLWIPVNYSTIVPK